MSYDFHLHTYGVVCVVLWSLKWPVLFSQMEARNVKYNQPRLDKDIIFSSFLSLHYTNIPSYSYDTNGMSPTYATTRKDRLIWLDWLTGSAAAAASAASNSAAAAAAAAPGSAAAAGEA